jgi:hypothetical protein
LPRPRVVPTDRPPLPSPARGEGKENPPPEGDGIEVLGNDLLSHRVTAAVPSALEGLTSVFGMGTGVSPPPWPPNAGDYTRPAPADTATDFGGGAPGGS